MKWFLIILFGIVVVVLIGFLVLRNQKDEKEFEDQLDNDYHKPKNDEGDIEIDEIMK